MNAPLVRVPSPTVRLVSDPSTNQEVFVNAFPSLRFNSPVTLKTPRGETNRIFVVQKSGQIIAVTNLANPSTNVFLDISDRVFDFSESGLLGLAFHPNFESNQRFFVSYVAQDGLYGDMRLSEFRARPGGAVADPESEIQMINCWDFDPIHQSGCLEFGPDGYLYMSVGDGGGLYDYVATQKLNYDFLSGILRLDVDRLPSSLPPNAYVYANGMATEHRHLTNYAIPKDNPYLKLNFHEGHPISPRRIRSSFFAIGLRNSWQFGFDPISGMLLANDTGQTHREEVNLILPGGNYGWPHEEGLYRHTNRWTTAVERQGMLPPLMDYGQPLDQPPIYDGGYAITAGIVYQGAAHPELTNHWVYSDFMTGEIRAMPLTNGAFFARVKELQDGITAAQAELTKGGSTFEASFEKWRLAYRQRAAAWKPLTVAVSGSTATQLSVSDDGWALAQGPLLPTDTYDVYTTGDVKVGSMKIELGLHQSLPNGGPGRMAAGGIWLTELQLTVQEGGIERPVKIAAIQSHFSQAGHSIANLIDGDSSTGWGIFPLTGQQHDIVINLEEPLTLTPDTHLHIKIQQPSYATIGAFRIHSREDLGASLDAIPPVIGASLIVDEPDEVDLRAAREYLAWTSFAYRSERAALSAAQVALREHFRTNQIQSIPVGDYPNAAAFGIHPRTQELLIADYARGIIGKLRSSDPAIDNYPATIEETGLFADIRTMTPHAGVVPYEINHPFWSDGLEKKRWFAIPRATARIASSADGSWQAPEGMIWAKHFYTWKENAPNEERPVETRALVKTRDGVYGLSYRWDESGKNAYLVPAAGATEEILVKEGETFRKQVWHFPSRADCLKCHTPQTGWAAGFNSLQLNRSINNEASGPNQIDLLAAAGYLAGPRPASEVAPALAALDDPDASVEFKVRSYLHANCASCHQERAAGRSQWNASFATPLSAMGLVNAASAIDADRKLVTPGSLVDSTLYERLSIAGDRHMPPLATSVLNTEALRLVAQWITNSLPARESFGAWQARTFSADALKRGPTDDADGDGLDNYAEFLLDKSPTDALSSWMLRAERTEGGVELEIEQAADLIVEIQTSTTPNVAQSWRPVTHSENRPFKHASPRQKRFTVRDDERAQYFRAVLREN